MFDLDPVDSQVILKRKKKHVECDMRKQFVSMLLLLIILHAPPPYGSGPQTSTEVLTFGLINNQESLMHEP